MAISYTNNMQHDKPKELPLKILQRADWGSSITPFKLILNEHDSPLICEKILRILTGKRIVASGTWHDQAVVAKLFYGERAARRHFQRELAGIETLLSSGVPTPRVLYAGSAYKKHVYVIIFELIYESRNLADVWQEKVSLEEDVVLMHAVTVELATQHVLGIVQRDLHLKNFILNDNQIFTLDGGNIDSFHEPLDKKSSLDHLALFFSQLGVGTNKLQEALFHVYTQSRGWLEKPGDLDYLKNAVKKCDQERYTNYSKKVMRTCTAFVKINKTNASIMYDREYQSPRFLAFLENPEKVFSELDTRNLKAGRSSTVAKIKVDGRTLVLKRYNVKGAWHWLRRSMRATRASQCWRLANLLRLFGVPTAKPVAFIEKRAWGIPNKSYFLMEYIKGQHLGDYFAQYKQDDAHFEKIAMRVVNMLENLTQLRLTHGDLKVTNILLDENERPVILDLDGMREHKTQAKANRAYKKEIKRFMKNWDKRPSVKALFEKLFQEKVDIRFN